MYKESDEGDDQELIELEVREGNVDEGDEVVLEKKYNCDITDEDSGQYPEGKDIGG